MRILVVGGTQFIGRYVTEELLRRGDEVTLFHRGKTNLDLFPEATHLLGDRNSDLSALDDPEWDATIDTSAYFPRQVRSLGATLGKRGGSYVYVSPVSAYATPVTSGYTEDAPLGYWDEPDAKEVTAANYGGLKALCERAAKESFPDIPVALVRPTYVVGPFDHTHRFTWWVEMIASGGSLVVPGPKDNPFQVIDVRDLAAFVAALAHGKAPGSYHTVGPAAPLDFAGFLAAVRDVVAPEGGTEFVWAEPALLAEIGVKQSAFPLWEGPSPDLLTAANPDHAYRAGLKPRSLQASIADTHAWALESGYTPSFSDGFGLSESELGQLRTRLAMGR
ncbi:NAD-dependent epimerase/dehydratase family protein [Ferrimicrobium sp.]|uniref:NAD-dependent epimerase/dehydratase family protein n=1 Tax=Ferrimicrobium sp. TaxID=2926050 RepID=UPI00260B15FC|nr:NAD-dependent epimerase/dehydratase family protein [Ferrimicrobium sp.]